MHGEFAASQNLHRQPTVAASDIHSESLFRSGLIEDFLCNRADIQSMKLPWSAEAQNEKKNFHEA
jgi:hypothetical protein